MPRKNSVARKSMSRKTSRRLSRENEGLPAGAGASQLSAVQERALQQLSAGASISKVARSVGVDRRTIHRWLADDPHFAAAYNAWRRETVHWGRGRVLAMSDLALTTVHKAMKRGNARVALEVARATGAMDAAKFGPTDPEQLKRRRNLRERGRELALAVREDEIGFQEARRDKEHPWMKDVREVESLIDFLLGKRREALANESAEARAERLDHLKYYVPHPQTARLLTLADAAPESRPEGGAAPTAPSAAASAASDPPASAATSAQGAVEGPAPGAPETPGPGAVKSVEAVAPDSSSGNRTSASSVESKSEIGNGTAGPPPIRTRVRPVRAVAYDGSDESDNDPRWERIG